MFSMDSVLLCSCACVSVGVMLRLVIAPGNYCKCVDVSFFPFLYFNPSLSVCTPLSFMEILALCFAIRCWLILNKQPEKCCCHHLAQGKNAAPFLFLLKCGSTSSRTSQPPSQLLEQKYPHFSSKTSLVCHLQCITVRSANGPEMEFHIVPHFA